MRKVVIFTVWQVENPLGSYLIWALFCLGWLIAFISTLLINHLIGRCLLALRLIAARSSLRRGRRTGRPRVAA